MHSPEYSLTDLVAVLLQSIAARRGEKNVRLSEDSSELHWAFYRLKGKWGDAFPPLANLHFVTAGPFPYSHELNEALDTLQSSDEIARINPHYKVFSPAAYDDTSEWLDEQQELIAPTKRRKAALDDAVRELQEALVKSA